MTMMRGWERKGEIPEYEYGCLSQADLAGAEPAQVKPRPPAPPTPPRGPQDLYSQPDVRRVRAYPNGHPEQAAFVWGCSIPEVTSQNASDCDVTLNSGHRANSAVL